MQRNSTINLKEHIKILSVDFGERNYIRYKNLQYAARYISSQFKSYGYQPQEQHYEDPVNRGLLFSNIIATKIGKTKKTFVIGAHYDSILGSPGADDNASGVGVLLELSRLLHNKPLPYTIDFVAFVNEEPPFYFTEYMGSRVYAKRAKKEKVDIIGMISLETVGYYSSKKIQKYPPILKFFYPQVADFIAVVGNYKSRKLVSYIANKIKSTKTIRVESLASSLIPAIYLSDNWSFYKEGYKAVMITDTAFLRNPFYHTQEDTYEKLDYDKLILLTEALYKTLISKQNDT